MKNDITWAVKANHWSIAMRKIFPTPISVDGVTIKLHADGTVSGDVEAFCRAVEAMKTYGTSDGMMALQIWSLVALIRLMGERSRGFVA